MRQLEDMSLTHDLRGRRFSKLTAIRPTDRRVNKRVIWFCECECGGTALVSSSNLLNGNTTSCGCFRRTRMMKHGGASSTRAYRCWCSMLHRCENPNDKGFHRYGGRGITVCAEWHDFETFRRDMGDPPDNRSIERINNNRGYSPDNCKWATDKEQQRNLRSNRMLTLNGVTKCASDWADIVGLTTSQICDRLRLGWSAEDAITTPKLKKGQRYGRTSRKLLHAATA